MYTILYIQCLDLQNFLKYIYNFVYSVYTIFWRMNIFIQKLLREQDLYI